MTIAFFVPGQPRPQGSKRAINHRSTGRAIVIESAGQNLVDWRGDVKHAAIIAMGVSDVLKGPIRANLVFNLPRPKSAIKSRVWPTTRPDIDKLARAVLDAITYICFPDDAVIVELSVKKQWAEPVGVNVHLTTDLEHPVLRP